MPLEGEYAPGTSAWAREQAESYEESKGERAATLGDRPIVVVTSVGARSGKLRKTALMRVEHDGRYVIVASDGAKPRNPAWYHNIAAKPQVEVQDGAQTRDMTARELSGAEYEQWWERAVDAFPTYASYRAKAPRHLPMFLLEPDLEPDLG